METTVPEPIAIVGFSFRLPGGATNVDRLWEILANGEQVWTDVPESRYNWRAFHHPNADARGTHNARGGFFLQQDITEFDAKFFGIPDAEAAAMDPQQRLLLEVSYEALENAGMPLEQVSGSRTGVYVALVSRDYDRQIYKDPSQIPKHHLTGCGDATACGRISYVFDLKGPAMTIDTGCSGGMVGVHLACQSLRLGESDMALVTGSNLLLGPDMTMAMSNLHMVNENGRCYPFDDRGAGYGRAEGVAVFVLKRLRDAERDGDAIRAIIENSGVGQDGRTNGILLPSSTAQAQLATEIYGRSQMNPLNVPHVEMHGTGTAAGDAAEIRSIRQVFVGESMNRAAPLTVGSIKANLGHSESTSGLSGILSAVLSIQKGLIPPVAALEALKPDVSSAIKDGNITVPRHLQKWPPGIKRASVNSFGFGGTNVHVILAEYSASASVRRDQDPQSWRCTGLNGTTRFAGASLNGSTNGVSQLYTDAIQPCLFLLSAKSKGSLKANLDAFRNWVSGKELSALELSNLAKTLATRRTAFSWRTSILAKSKKDLIESLPAARLNRKLSAPAVAFLFTGQGAQYATMGQQLMSYYPSFARSLQRSQEILQSLGAKWNLIEELCKAEAVSKVNTTQLSQPATTALQIALVSLLDSLGVRPSAVLGHSSGEVAAAFACGILSHEDAILISYHKGFVSDWCKTSVAEKGAMLAAGLGEADIQAYLQRVSAGKVSVACVNSPQSVTVSGDEAAVLALQQLLEHNSIFNRLLKVDTAYHSHHMQAVASQFQESIACLKSQAPKQGQKFFSSVTGGQHNVSLDSSYWVDNLVSKVRFSEASGALAKVYAENTEDLVLIEIGPHSALDGPVRQTMALRNSPTGWSYMPSLVRKKSPLTAILEMTSRLWEYGVPVMYSHFPVPGQASSSASFELFTDLPTYSWDHTKSYWHESRLSKDYRLRQHAPHELLGLRLVGPTLIEPVFRLILSLDDLPWLQEHVIDGFALYPGSAFLVHAIEALKQITEDRGRHQRISHYFFKNVFFTKSIVVPGSPATVELLTSLRPSSHRATFGTVWHEFRITSVTPDGNWGDNCHGLIGCQYEAAHTDGKSWNSDQWTDTKDNVQYDQSITKMKLYQNLRKNGIDYGESFTIIQDLRLGDRIAVADIEVPDIPKSMPLGYTQPHVIHPATLDAFMHTALPLYHRFCSEGPVMLTSIKEVAISADILNTPGSKLAVTCKLTEAGRRSGVVDVSIAQQDSSGRMIEVATLSNEEFRGIGEAHNSLAPSAEIDTLICSTDWVPCDMASSGELVCKYHHLLVASLSAKDSLSSLARQLSVNMAPSFLSSTASVGNAAVETQSTVCVVLDDSAVNTNLGTLASLLPTRVDCVLWVQIVSKTNEFDNKESYVQHSHWRDEQSDHIILHCNEDIPLHEFQDAVATIIRNFFASKQDARPNDQIYQYSHQTLKVPRLQPYAEAVVQMQRSAGLEPEDQMGLFHCDRTLELEFKTPGLLGSAHFVPLEHEFPLSSDELEVKIFAYGINAQDVSVVLGRAKPSQTMLGEFAGIVTKVGTSAQSRFNQGDRVYGWGASHFANVSRVPQGFAQHLSENISFEEGASMPSAFHKAFLALVKISRLQKSQSILVHNATEPAGQAAIAIARSLGAEVYATVSSSEAASLLVDQFCLDRHRIFSNQTNRFQQQLTSQTNEQGVDVVLVCRSEELVESSIPCLVDGGILISLEEHQTGFNVSGAENIIVATVDLGAMRRKHPESTVRTFSKAVALSKSIDWRGPSRLVLPIGELSNAFKLTNDGSVSEMIVLTMDDLSAVLQPTIQPAPPILDSTGVYAVVGDALATSKALCTYLANRGARNIISIGHGDSDEDLFSNGTLPQEHQGVNLQHIRGDDTTSLSKLVKRTLLQGSVKVAGILHVESDCEEEPAAKLRVILNDIITRDATDFFVTLSPCRSITTYASSGATSNKSLQSCNEAVREVIVRTVSTEYTGDASGEQPSEIKLNLSFELSGLLDYLLSPSTQKECPSELFLMPLSPTDIDRKSPLLDELRKLWTDTPDTASGTEGLETIEQRIKYAHDREKISNLIGTEICAQLATFCAIDQEDIRMDMAIATVGLDSLLAIEFKNWIVRVMQAPMQTTEILDAASLHSLVSLIMLRSNLVTGVLEVNGTPTPNEQPNKGRMPAANGFNALNGTITNGREATWTGDKLPALPLPELASLINQHLNGVRPFASEQEFKEASLLAEEFQSPGNQGLRLYQRLQALKAADADNWYHDLFLENQYLSRKGALAPYMLFFFTHPLSPVNHTQADRAALIASVLIQYRRDLENGRLAPRYLNEQRLCMDLYKNLFNTCREPRQGLDVLRSHPGNNFFVVLRKGVVHRLDFGELQAQDLFRLLEATFSSILGQEVPDSDWLGILSGDHRTSWAANYSTFIDSSPQNKEYIDTLQKCAFIICLDDASPQTAQERARQVHFGDGLNRWFDKTVQYVVCSNGVSGMVADHTGLDAPNVHEINLKIAAAIQEHDPDAVERSATALPWAAVKHTRFTDVNLKIHECRMSYQKIIAKRQHFFPSIPMGSSFMKQHRVPPNSGFQLIVQLASQYYFGYLPACWETVLQMTYHKGRVEINQVVTMEAAKFVQVAAELATPLSVCRQLFLEAARKHSGNVLAATRSGGSDRYLSLLREISKDGETDPPLYNDPPYKRSRPRKLMSNCFTTNMAENGCVMRDDEGVWLHFELEPDRVKFSGMAPTGQCERFTDALQRAAARVKEILSLGVDC